MKIAIIEKEMHSHKLSAMADNYPADWCINPCTIYACGGLFRKVFTFNPYKTCYTCPGPVFRYEFNGDARFGIGLTKKGNLLVLYVFCTIFQSKFNCDGHYMCARLLI